MPQANLNRGFKKPRFKAYRATATLTMTTVEKTTFSIRYNFDNAFRAAPKVVHVGTDATMGRLEQRLHAEADANGVTIYCRSGATPSGFPAGDYVVYADVEGET